MFEAVSHQFVQSVGNDSLLPVPSIDTGSNLKLCDVVMKKETRKFLFWKKKRYIPCNIPLQNLLVGTHGLNVNPDDRDIVHDYEEEYTFSLNGKIEGGIMAKLVSLSASDSVKVKADLGDLNKKEVRLNILKEALKDRKLKTDDSFVKKICGNSKKVMCVVIAIIYLCNDASISRVENVEASADSKDNLPRTSSVEDEGKVHSKKKSNIGLPKETVLAYKVVELKINLPAGSIEPIIGQDYTDGSSSMDSPDKAIEVNGVMDDLGLGDMKSILQSIISLGPKKRNDVNSVIMKFMEFPSNIGFIRDLLSDVEDKLDSENKEYVVEVKSLEKILQTPKKEWMRLLEIIGFKSKSDEELLLSGEPQQLLVAFRHVFDAMMKLGIENLDLLRSCTEGFRKALLYFCTSTMSDQTLVELKNSQVITRDDHGKKLAENLGYTFKVAKPSPAIEQITWVLNAMYA